MNPEQSPAYDPEPWGPGSAYYEEDFYHVLASIEPQPPTDWCRDYSNVKELGRYLVNDGHLPEPKFVLAYFCTPWKWSREWAAYRLLTKK